ncbi:MAG: Methionine aminopeptidase 1 [Firmicutes bacterium ADurb.Bin153]|nr:MAG: Methionine aminopeptidase 1 [Firmicutes bacterium ADurb.Bin153]
MILKTPQEILKMRKSGKITAAVLAMMGELARPGVTTGELDRKAERLILDMGGKPAFKGYMDYPSTLCTSVNDEVIHGMPGDRVLEEGDILSIDTGAVLDGFYSDAAVTLPIGDVSEEASRLMEATRRSLEKGIEAARAGGRLGDIGNAVQSVAEGAGYSVVREFVGHGIGRKMHEPPNVPNYGAKGTGIRLVGGMTLAIEPMVNQSSHQVRVDDDGWTVRTRDGGLSAHFEHTVAITDEGIVLLTVL